MVRYGGTAVLVGNNGKCYPPVTGTPQGVFDHLPASCRGADPGGHAKGRAPWSGTLTIPAGHTSGTVSVSIKGDRVKEPNETLALNIYAPSIGTIADPVGIGAIRNDD